MIDRHGWTSDQWDAMSYEAKVMTIASNIYWDEIRSKRNRSSKGVSRNKGAVKEVVI